MYPKDLHLFISPSVRSPDGSSDKHWVDRCLHPPVHTGAEPRLYITRYTSVNRGASPDRLHHLCTGSCSRTCTQTQKHIRSGARAPHSAHANTSTWFFLPFASVNVQLVEGCVLIELRCFVVVALQQYHPGPLRVPDCIYYRSCLQSGAIPGYRSVASTAALSSSGSGLCLNAGVDGVPEPYYWPVPLCCRLPAALVPRAGSAAALAPGRAAETGLHQFR